MLDTLTVDSQPVPGFTPKGTYYEVAIPFETKAVPIVGASSSHPFTVTQSPDIPGRAAILVRDEANPSNLNVYTVVFKRLPLIGTPEGMVKYPIVGVTASAVPEAAKGIHRTKRSTVTSIPDDPLPESSGSALILAM